MDFERNVIRLEETKNGERWALPLVSNTKRVLEKVDSLHRKDTDVVFPRLVIKKC